LRVPNNRENGLPMPHERKTKNGAQNSINCMLRSIARALAKGLGGSGPLKKCRTKE
jgi:hypothetical protein